MPDPVGVADVSRPSVARAEVLHADPLLLGLLEATVVRDAALESLIVANRRAALEEVWQRPTLPLRTLAALAHQAFNTEYVYEETDEERQRVEALAASFDGAAQAPLHRYAVYALYRALGSLPAAARIAAELAATPLAALARRQILEPLEERRLREGIDIPPWFSYPEVVECTVVTGQAADYLLKPIKRGRLAATVQRLKERLGAARLGSGERARAPLDHVEEMLLFYFPEHRLLFRVLRLGDD